MTAPVERRHRELAFSAVWNSKPYPNERIWLETGEGETVGPLLRSVAQAIADQEAAAAHRAWDEGFDAGQASMYGDPNPNAPDTPNPYPEPTP